jgi:UDP-N-acetylmuramyl-tripeptide synthetase
MKNLIKKFIPKFILSWYHLGLAHLANLIYGHPSEKLIVIGVTGTNGKSTTVNLIAKILEQAGHRVVVSSTVNFNDGKQEWLNNLKMTMPGRFFLQKLLSDGIKNGCDFAVIESSSEGILQHRQIGIHYDCVVFTNLTPEHIQAHGGFENYKQAKLEYLKLLELLPKKIIGEKTISKTIIANADDLYAKEFLNFPVDKKITYNKADAKNLQIAERGIEFTFKNVDFKLNLKGIFDVYNALAAIATTLAFGIDLKICQQALEKIPNIPGRMEVIDEGQNFRVVIDYAPEPESLRQLYATINLWPHEKIIHVLGSTGGGRDRARRKILGEIAFQNSNIIIVTNEDPYDDDPQEIIDDVAVGAPNALKILDRREAIAKALALAQPNDLVLITGKGSEQKMAVKGGYIPWDDRTVVREELKKLLNNH